MGGRISQIPAKLSLFTVKLFYHGIEKGDPLNCLVTGQIRETLLNLFEAVRVRINLIFVNLSKNAR